MELQQHTSARHKTDSDVPSEDEEDFEEREDDRANDPACVECDDGGALLIVLWLVHCAISLRQMLCVA